ncbi:hypothetical protein [Evansella cellulosilytica]|uniref:Uncharacterized protein n=1 Tax=Evansella cellulosilytica (strain ATCC 21833 / DSM 2522 / FERM P-1141 / JCM 9156 / N-4) TaxID=649639 RepID=E6U1M1_EVAC2|nr:hypothetical protein [Evansella cellulosilytica]ADU30384.1 hypothetical protein Bcell_2123 [Evansella cellulosilytica DSM 2522]
MSKNKWVRSISFNKKNEKDIARLKLIGKKSFSRFIKKLLDDEIIRRESEVPSNTTKSDTPQMKQRVITNSRSKPIRPKQQSNKPFNPMLGRK